MSKIALIVVGVIVGISLNIGIPYYFITTTKSETKSSAVAVVLSLVLGPFVGFSYARPTAWGLGFASTLLFFVPIGIGAGVAFVRGSVVVGGALAGYFTLAAVVTAAVLTRDQNDQFGDHVST